MSAEKCAVRSVFLLYIFLTALLSVECFAEELVILKIILNSEDKGEFFLVLTPDKDIWVKEDDIYSMGLKKGLGGRRFFESEPYISLRSVPGLSFQVSKEDVVLNITAPPGMFREHTVNISYTKPYKVINTKDHAAFINYALNYDNKGRHPFTGLAGEVGINTGGYFGMSSFSYHKVNEKEKTVRLMTNLTGNDREKLKTTIIGDFTASSGFLGPGEVLGGINISKNYSIDPLFLKFPSIDINGTVDTPSDIRIYMNGLLVQEKRLSPGKFSFTNVPATVGLGNSTVVIKDAFGRERIVTNPYYYSDRLLKKGLHEYSYSTGYIRKDLGVKSFSYDRPAFMGFHNYGFSDSVKAGISAEVSGNIFNLGPSASFLVPGYGVLDTTAAFSSSKGKHGFTVSAGSSFQSRKISAGISIRHNSREYSALSIRPSADKARLQLRGSIGFGSKKTGFLTAEYSYSDMYENNGKHRAAVLYNWILHKNATFFITALETKEAETSYEVFTGIHIYFGHDTSGSLSYSGNNRTENKKASIQKSIPSGSGFGYGVDLNSSDGNAHASGDLTYQNNYGVYKADFSNRTKSRGYGLSISGGIGFIDNSAFLSRPIRDSFAKIKVKDLEGVRVYYSGNEVGRTDRNGEFIIPVVQSFQDNRIEIESSDIPLNYNIESLKQYISPAYRSGALVEFNVNRIQGFEGAVYIIEDGIERPAGSGIINVQANGKNIRGLIGRDGEIYIENIPHGEHSAKVVYKDEECIFDVNIPDSEEIMVDLGKLICAIE